MSTGAKPITKNNWGYCDICGCHHYLNQPHKKEYRIFHHSLPEEGAIYLGWTLEGALESFSESYDRTDGGMISYGEELQVEVLVDGKKKKFVIAAQMEVTYDIYDIED